MKLYKLIILIGILTTISLNAKSLRIEVSDLQKNLNTYKIIDTRNEQLYLDKHIKGALNLPIKLTYNDQQTNGKVIQPTKAQELIRSLGLDVNDKIAIYDDGTFFDAARLFWTFEVYGFKNVKLLNGGLEQWLKDGFQTTKIIPKIKKSDYIVSVDHKRLATKFTTQIATKNPNQVILDARPSSGYDGETSSAQRFGHIKKALHFPASHNINYDEKITKLQSINDLKKIYSKIGKKKKIIVYCAIGRISSTNYFALRELDYDVANYDSSWREWGNDANLPIINPSEEL